MNNIVGIKNLTIGNSSPLQTLESGHVVGIPEILWIIRSVVKWTTHTTRHTETYHIKYFIYFVFVWLRYSNKDNTFIDIFVHKLTSTNISTYIDPF